MIIPDLNVLVYAHNSGFPDHPAARSWWEESLNQRQTPVALAWVVILGFVRLCTSSAVLVKPMHVAQAITIVRSWLAQPAVRIVTPGENHPEILFKLLAGAGAGGNLTTHAHLAGLALEYRAEIATADSDFTRFHGVRWFNPLKAGRRR